ncbi:MAG: archease [Candidatus Omnitrophica bacterium]|nr:archease [Candidatus Omnitrophota bacterium]
MKRYKLISHTADIGLCAYGKDLKQLFVNAAVGCSEILAELKNVQAQRKLKIKLTAPNIEELFLSWLRELLYQFNGKEIILKEFSIDKLTDQELSAEVKGEKIDLSKHALKKEIKAVTYHALQVKQVKGVWQGQVIFDV